MRRTNSGSFGFPSALKRQDSRMSEGSQGGDGGSYHRRGSLLPVLNNSFKRQISGTIHTMSAVRRLKLCACRRLSSNR